MQFWVKVRMVGRLRNNSGIFIYTINPIEFSAFVVSTFYRRNSPHITFQSYKKYQYQHTSEGLTLRHRHRTREQSNLAKQVSQVGRTGCRFVWTFSRISERSLGESVLCRPVHTSEAHRVFLDLHDPIGVHAAVPGQLLHDLFAQFLPESNPPASRHGVQLGGFKAGEACSPWAQKGILPDQSPVFFSAVHDYFPRSSEIRCEPYCRPSRKALRS